MEQLKILFLDIDGVLNDHSRFPNRWSGISRSQVELLNRVLAAVPDLQIVLSSAWRYRFDNAYLVEGLLCCHGMDCFERVHGVTERDPIPDGHPSFDDTEWWSAMGLKWRAKQIREYLQEHPAARYAVLDDLPIDIEHLIQTDGKVGLTEGIVEALIRHFSEPTDR